MKKLIYNKDTKWIDIIEQEEVDESQDTKEIDITKQEEMGKFQNIEEIEKSIKGIEENVKEIEENVKEIERVQKLEKEDLIKESKGIRGWLEKNKIFFEFVSYIFVGIMGVMVSFAGLVVSKKTMKIYEMQLAIEENDKKPYFTIECEEVWEKIERTEGTDKIAKCRYTLINNGGNITNVYLSASSYIIFYVSTSKEYEWYIFKYKTNKFEIGHSFIFKEEEKDRKFVFYEYESEKGKDEIIIDEQTDLGYYLAEYLTENLNKYVTFTVKNYLDIIYIDYKGENQRKIFEFAESDIREVENEQEGVSLDGMLDVPKTIGNTYKPAIDINDKQAVGEALKKEIENWLEKNKGKKGYEALPNLIHFFNEKESE